jgi:hypothetical protein
VLIEVLRAAFPFGFQPLAFGGTEAETYAIVCVRLACRPAYAAPLYAPGVD